MSGRDTTEKRESILDAALEVFQSEGYGSASMDRIAEAAKASKRTVYNHFDGKEALFKAVTERFMGEVSAVQAIDYDPRRDLSEQLKAFAATKERVASDATWLSITKVAMSVAVTDPELVRESLSDARKGEDHLRNWLQAASADGRLRVDDPALASEIFWSSIAGAILWPQLIHGPMDPLRIARLRDEVVRMFLARFAAAG